jgi:hypothetical protein
MQIIKGKTTKHSLLPEQLVESLVVDAEDGHTKGLFLAINA